MKQIILATFLIAINFTLIGQAIEVSIDTLGNGDFQLLRGGSPYFIKGAAYSGHFLDSLPVYGGNSIRTYQTDSTTIDILNKADLLGITVTLGLYAKHEEHGFNYNDTTAVKQQLEDFKYWVNQYKNHPAVLMWSIGNEADARYTNYRLWDAVNDIAEMIHEEDPLHPTMTVLAGAHDVDINEINARAPAVDILGVNVYKSLYNLQSQLSSNSWSKPYVVTEWGVDGTWENLNTKRTSWLAPIELNSTSKAYIYRTRYNDFIEGDATGQILGSYAFVWGHQNHGEVESWYSMFNVLGESTETVEAMQYKWTGSYPTERAPRITDMKLNGFNEFDNVTLYSGAVNSAYVTAYDPNSDSLTYEWAIVKERYKLENAASGNSFPGLTGLITQIADSTVVFNTPSDKGAYRLYVVVHDGNDKIAMGGIPFFVEDHTVLRNYDGISVLDFDSVTGGSHNGAENPDVSGLNQTSGVGKYIADGSNSYAKLVFSSPVAIEDASFYKSGKYKIKMEVRTNAPIGTVIQLNFENKTNYGSYPNGRNSTYKITTTSQNQWESLSFNYNNTPDLSISDLEVDQLTFTFDPGNSSSYTYYFDNIRVEKTSPDELSEGDRLKDYESVSLISYESSNGAYNVIENTLKGGTNMTDSTSVYVRSSVTYDALKFTNEVIEDASIYESGKREFVFDIKTSAPLGTVLEIQLRNTSMVGTYPNGRHSTYRTKVLEQNSWYEARFKYIDSPDSSVPDDSIDQMIFFLSPGVVSTDTFYIDNIRDVTVNKETSALPNPWKNMDIGFVGIPGSATATTNGSLFTIKGSGENIWGSNDEFQYVYQPFSGNGEILCLIQSISPDVDDYVKAGLMVRETLDDDAKNALIYVTPENGNAFQFRSTTGSTTSKVSDASSVDRWLKLKRTGNVFEGYQSNDGVTWRLVSSQTIAMADDAYIGLSVTSHNDVKMATVKFRNVSIIPLSSYRDQHNKTLSITKTTAEPMGKSIKIYPNPVTNHLYLKSTNNNIITAKIYDLNGNLLVMSLNGQGEKPSLNMSGLYMGLYILKIEFEDQTSMSKLIVKN